jgi:flagellin
MEVDLGMIINHNISALNTYSQMGMNSANASKNMEKLSSGLRINRAGDDAAGLAISEKMRGQIRGLDQASRNAQDGISLIQTAEGALNESHSILQRMRELSVQSANSSNNSTDRAQLQKEIDQMSEELSRIGNDAEFNTQKLLSGNFEGNFHVGSNENQNIKMDLGDMRGYSLGISGGAKVDVSGTFTAGAGGATDIEDGTYNVVKEGSSYNLMDSKGIKVATSTNGKDWNASLGEADDAFAFDEAVVDGSIKVSGSTFEAKATVDNTGLQAGTYTYDSGTKVLKDQNNEIVAYEGATAGEFTDKEGTVVLTLDSSTAGDTLTAGEIKVGGIDISSEEAANKAITTINSAIETVSAERSKMGAVQNRLEHTINNLGTTSQNLTAAESRIRDVDMAKEMMEFTKNNILNQASQAMLSQANQQPQAVLQLLR